MTEPVTAADVITAALSEDGYDDTGQSPEGKDAWLSFCRADADRSIVALREACGGGDIVIRTDGTLATLNLNTRYVGSHITVETFRVVPVERGA